jgi:CheY-like chemotaxis protein
VARIELFECCRCERGPRTAEVMHGMLLHVVIEVVLAFAMLFTSQCGWQLVKSRLFLARVFSDQAFWEKFITRERLNDSSPYTATMTKRSDLGFMFNIRNEVNTEVVVHRRLILVAGIGVGVILVCSWCLGLVYFIINFGLALLSGSGPLCQSARDGVMRHVLTLGIILHKWRNENAAECDAFVKQASGLRVLYEAVEKVTANSTALHIVVADDEEWLCEMYSMALRNWFPGVSVECFQDGLKAWEYLAKHDPDLLIMDINRTGMDGIETLRHLAALGKRYPIFVASGTLGTQEMHDRTRTAAGSLRLSLNHKPFTIEQLRSEISRLLGLKACTG